MDASSHALAVKLAELKHIKQLARKLLRQRSEVD
jgi:hypothetical protein